MGSKLTKKRIYKSLQRAAENFRTTDGRQEKVEAPVREAMGKMTSASATYGIETLPAFPQPGTQQDAAEFLSHVMNRLCKYEIDQGSR